MVFVPPKVWKKFNTTAEALRYTRKNTDFVYCKSRSGNIDTLDSYLEGYVQEEETEEKNSITYALAGSWIWELDEDGEAIGRPLTLYTDWDISIYVEHGLMDI